MFTVIVNLTVKTDRVDDFLAAIDINSRATLVDEPGCLRFDVHRHTEDPTKFLLYEIYSDENAFYVAHRQAPHYAEWRKATAACIEPGTQINTYATPAFPDRIPEGPGTTASNRAALTTGTPLPTTEADHDPETVLNP